MKRALSKGSLIETTAGSLVGKETPATIRESRESYIHCEFWDM